MEERQEAPLDEVVEQEQAVDTPEQEQPQETPLQAKQRENQEASERNWRETRQALKAQEQVIRELKSQLDQRNTPEQKELDILSTLSQDDLLTRAQAERLAELKARQIVEETMKKQHASTAEERIRMKYPDFDDVLTDENIQFLRENKPSLVRSVLANSDPYAQAEAAYELAKSFCPQNNSESRENMKKLEENKAKPLSSNAVKKPSSALDNAHAYTQDKQLTKEGRDYYYQQMQQAKKYR